MNLHESWGDKSYQLSQDLNIDVEDLYVIGAKDFQQEAILQLKDSKIQDCENSRDQSFNEGLELAISILTNLKSK